MSYSQIRFGYEEKRESVQRLRDRAVHEGGRFILVMVPQPKKKSLEVHGLEVAITERALEERRQTAEAMGVRVLLEYRDPFPRGRGAESPPPLSLRAGLANLGIGLAARRMNPGSLTTASVAAVDEKPLAEDEEVLAALWRTLAPPWSEQTSVRDRGWKREDLYERGGSPS